MSELFAVECNSGEISSDDDELVSDCSEPEEEDLTTRRRGMSRGMVSKSKSDSFCDCLKRGREKYCICGEEDTSK